MVGAMRNTVINGEYARMGINAIRSGDQSAHVGQKVEVTAKVESLSRDKKEISITDNDGKGRSYIPVKISEALFSQYAGLIKGLEKGQEIVVRGTIKEVKPGEKVQVYIPYLDAEQIEIKQVA